MVANIYWGIVSYLPGTVLNINTILVYLIITVLWDYVPLSPSSQLTDNNAECREISLPNAQSLDANPGPCPWPLPTEGQAQGIKTSALWAKMEASALPPMGQSPSYSETAFPFCNIWGVVFIFTGFQWLKKTSWLGVKLCLGQLRSRAWRQLHR